MLQLASSAGRRTLTLAALLCAAGGSAIRVGPGSPFAPGAPGPGGVPPRVVSDPAPSSGSVTWTSAPWELLVTVGALREASQRADFAVARPADLRAVLADLRTRPTLPAAQAQISLDALRAALGSVGERQMAEARAQLERRAALQLASARLAREEGGPGLGFYRLAFQVPGGQGTVLAVQEGRDFNPFRQGVPASVLRLIEGRLTPPR